MCAGARGVTGDARGGCTSCRRDAISSRNPQAISPAGDETEAASAAHQSPLSPPPPPPAHAPASPLGDGCCCCCCCCCCWGGGGGAGNEAGEGWEGGLGVDAGADPRLGTSLGVAAAAEPKPGPPPRWPSRQPPSKVVALARATGASTMPRSAVASTMTTTAPALLWMSSAAPFTLPLPLLRSCAVEVSGSPFGS